LLLEVSSHRNQSKRLADPLLPLLTEACD